MQKKLLKPLLSYWAKFKKQTDSRLRRLKYQVILQIFKLIADLITNATIVILLLLVIFMTSITLSFSLSVFFGSHVKGFFAATLCLTLAACLMIWKRPAVNNYFAGLTISRYFEKLRETVKR